MRVPTADAATLAHLTTARDALRAASKALWGGEGRETATIVPTLHGWCIMLPAVTMVFSLAQGHTEADVEAAAVHLARQGMRIVREGC